MKRASVVAFIAVSLVIIILTAMAEALPSGNNNMKVVWTKAICNADNYCIDVRITCIGDEVVSIEPVTEGLYFPENWEDPRAEAFRNKWC